ncbi:MAG: DNA-directed RNA polymerase [Candidatus ainarchaeum sp.]|nr:DNA-directed RNA polymerase [Candidatus ainarchaeum sp.]MDD5096203.1 DNA-directed RNA polymerase [Candidatus ainarchaeum sp.]
MYYRTSVEEKVRLPPKFLVMKLTDAVTKMLREKYERRIIRDMGLVIAVENVDVGGDGTVIPGDGGIYYDATFDAITFMPYVNEVFSGEVKEVVEFGAFASIGPLDALIHISQIGNDKYSYDKKNKYLTTRRGSSLKKGDKVIVKVSTVSMRATTSDTKIGLTMRADGLGPEKEKRGEKKAAKKPAKGKAKEAKEEKKGEGK